MFTIKDVVFKYAMGSVQVEALRGVECCIRSGGITTLAGPSGSGKSTLLHLIGLIEPLQKGEIFFHDTSFCGLSEKQKNYLRKYKIGFIFQQFHLIPVLNAEENIAFFLERQGLPQGEIQRRVEETLKEVGLWEHRHKRPNKLSGGQRQRIAVARALAKNPEVIIADEPTANLDRKTGREVMRLFDRLAKEKNITVVIATHDPMVQSFAEEKIFLYDGQIAENEEAL